MLNIGVNPSPKDTVLSKLTGKKSAYFHSDEGVAGILLRSGISCSGAWQVRLLETPSDEHVSQQRSMAVNG